MYVPLRRFEMMDAEKMTYPNMIGKYRDRRNEMQALLPIMSHLKQHFDAFKSAQSCLVIGPGPGQYDLEFIQRCLPNLKTVVAVERDHHCAEEFKINVRKATNKTIDITVFEEDIEKWQGFTKEGLCTEIKFDVVLMSHLLYDIHPRLVQYFTDVFKKWLDPKKGLIVIIHISDDEDEQNRKINAAQNLNRYLKEYVDMLLDSDRIKEDLTKAGGEILWSQKYKTDIDLRGCTDDILQLFNIYSKKPINPEDMTAAIKTVAPNGFGTYVGEIFIATKKQI